MTDTAALPEGWYTTASNTAHYVGELTDSHIHLACSNIPTSSVAIRPPVAGDRVCQYCVSALYEAAAAVNLPMGECLGCSTLQALGDTGRIAEHTHRPYSNTNEVPCAGQGVPPARHDGLDDTRGDGVRKRWNLMREYEQERARFIQGLNQGAPVGGLICDNGGLLAHAEVAMTLCDHLIDNGDYMTTMQIALRELLRYSRDPGTETVMSGAVQRLRASGIVDWLRWAEAKMRNPSYDPWDVPAWEFVEGILQRP